MFSDEGLQQIFLLFKNVFNVDQQVFVLVIRPMSLLEMQR